jgi:hypothetical protein
MIIVHVILFQSIYNQYSIIRLSDGSNNENLRRRPQQIHSQRREMTLIDVKSHGQYIAHDFLDLVYIVRSFAPDE